MSIFSLLSQSTPLVWKLSESRSIQSQLCFSPELYYHLVAKLKHYNYTDYTDFWIVTYFNQYISNNNYHSWNVCPTTCTWHHQNFPKLCPLYFSHFYNSYATLLCIQSECTDFFERRNEGTLDEGRKGKKLWLSGLVTQVPQAEGGTTVVCVLSRSCARTGDDQDGQADRQLGWAAGRQLN